MFLAFVGCQTGFVGIRFDLIQFTDIAYSFRRECAVFVQGICKLTSGMCPTTIHGYAFFSFKPVVCLIAVTLDHATIAAKQFPGDIIATAASVIPEHDVSCDGVSHAPLITLTGLVFLIVYDRYHAFIYLYIFTREYPSSKQVIYEFKFLDRRFIQTTHSKVTDDDTALLVLLYQPVEWQMINELPDNDVCQNRGACDTFADRYKRQRCN